MIIKADLQKIIKELLSLKKEGVYWDFKQEWANNKIDFLHDIICMANAQHDGDRYLIYGVEDKTYKAIGIEENSSNHKRQADVIDLLRNAKFSNGDIPDILVERIEIENKKIDVVIIINRRKKPYYISTEYKEGQGRLYPGAIYTRTGDTNTPKNCTASLYNIEYMWKERFGLTFSPLERMKMYLLDYDNWIESNTFTAFENSEEKVLYYYKIFPEFTLTCTDNDNIKLTDPNFSSCRYFFSRAYVECMLSEGYMHLKYHNTILDTRVFCSFDNNKKEIILPNISILNGIPFEYYIINDENSCSYFLQYFLSNRRTPFSLKENEGKFEIRYPLSAPMGDGLHGVIPVFEDVFEFCDFQKYIKREIKEYNIMTCYKFNRPSFCVSKDSEEYYSQNKKFKELYKLYIEFKNLEK